MVVLSNVLAYLVSVDVIYIQHATESYLTSTETRHQFCGGDKRRQRSIDNYTLCLQVRAFYGILYVKFSNEERFRPGAHFNLFQLC